MKKALSLLLITLSILFLISCSRNSFRFEYGVFIGAEAEDVDAMKDYRIIVVEGQLFDKNEVKALQDEGHEVWSYINVGSVEEYRPYFDEYEDITLDVYENWEDERWVDVTQDEWKDFVVDELAGDLADKGFDGLFVDNLDVYYLYPSEESFQNLTQILRSFKEMGFYVCINGGDTFVSECIERGVADELFDAVNQESVLSCILWDEDAFGVQDESESSYFREYLKDVKKHGFDVYLLEYTKDEDLAREIREFCEENGYGYYISESLELGA